MKIAVGCDTPAYFLKLELVKDLEEKGHQVTDVGCHSAEMSDYTIFAKKVGEGVASGEYDRGILICGTGQGMNIAANKVKGIRAALCYDILPALLSREHNDSNVLCTGAWLIKPDTLKKMVSVWLGGKFQNKRHVDRIEQISEYENNH